MGELQCLELLIKPPEDLPAISEEARVIGVVEAYSGRNPLGAQNQPGADHVDRNYR
ncbi:hypothetical protein MFKK_16840 [Halopseudomonas aestusnigri]|nr:hypothetical protein MFKK_16840 [Halopseudomonas aestusnigri]